MAQEWATAPDDTYDVTTTTGMDLNEPVKRRQFSVVDFPFRVQVVRLEVVAPLEVYSVGCGHRVLSGDSRNPDRLLQSCQLAKTVWLNDSRSHRP